MFQIALLLSVGSLVFWGAQSQPTTPPERAFYFWKTQWNGGEVENAALANHRVQNLYLRFFDVEWDDAKKDSYPVSALEVRAPLPAPPIKMIPVVYLTNAVMIHTPYANLESLAQRVWKKVAEMAEVNRLQVQQLQLDCDWSDGSRRNYFHFLDVLKRNVVPAGVELSATLRLHQIKYAKRTGVPPVQRGMLMFYNFGRIQADSPKSSIFNAADAAKYTRTIKDYSLPLDISLPLFSWVVHSRDGKVLTLLDKADSSDLDALKELVQEKPMRYRVKSSFFYRGKYLAEGDLLAVEETDPAVTRLAADLALQGAGSGNWIRKKNFKTVAFFDLDERNLNRYGNSEIESIFRKF